MAVAAKELRVLEKLDKPEMEMVMSFASSLINNRQDHSDAYYKFQDIRNKMTERNPMSMEEIDNVIHSKS